MLACGGRPSLLQPGQRPGCTEYPRRLVSYLPEAAELCRLSADLAIGCGLAALQCCTPCARLPRSLGAGICAAHGADRCASCCARPPSGHGSCAVDSRVRQGCSDYKIRLACPTALPSASPTVTSAPTEAPTWDAGGPPCSGHGQCAGRGGCACQCSSGWYGAQCGKFFIRSATARARPPARPPARPLEYSSTFPSARLPAFARDSLGCSRPRGRSGARRGERVRRRAARALLGVSVPSGRGGGVLLAGTCPAAEPTPAAGRIAAPVAQLAALGRTARRSAASGAHSPRTVCRASPADDRRAAAGRRNGCGSATVGVVLCCPAGVSCDGRAFAASSTHGRMCASDRRSAGASTARPTCGSSCLRSRPTRSHAAQARPTPPVRQHCALVAPAAPAARGLRRPARSRRARD